MPSPPKPWEVNNGAAATTPVVSQSLTESSIPTVPERPSTLTSTATSTLNNMNTFGGGLGTSSYGGYGSSYGTGFGSSYGTGYGTGYGSSYGGGYGGYGSSYGGYGSTYNRMGYGGYGSSYGSYGMGYNRYGMGGYGGGMYGPEGPDSLSQQMESGTRATFDVIYSIVGAFGGFAQMLDSTYMATHSSFMAMVGVAEQFGNLKHYLGNIFGIFALIRWVKKLMYRITGRPIPPKLLEEPKEEQANGELTNGEQTEATENTALQITENGETSVETTRVVRKRPIIIFLAIVTGLPYLIYKLIQRSNEIRARQQRMMIPQYGGPTELATVLHDFIAENPIELTIHRGDTVEVLSKVDPATGLPCEWWQGRLANGIVGIFPANYVQIVN